MEHDVRGNGVHDAFAAYARALIAPVAERLGWEAGAQETPGLQKLRRAVLADLGAWGDAQVIAQARERFARFTADRRAVAADDQAMVLSIVARNADAADFARLHAVARSASNETELRRYYLALMQVRDRQLAEQAAQVAISAEIPPQAAAARLQLVGALAEENPRLAWTTFTQNLDLLMAPQGRYAPLIIAQYSPEFFWDAAPLPEIEAWVTAHVPAQMADSVARGMESARFRRSEQAALTPALQAFLGWTTARSGN
jgi:aminopeptidase N